MTGLTVFAYAIQSVILSMEDVAGPRAKKHFLRICDAGAVAAVICYNVFGVVCYAAFGDHTNAIVLLSLPKTGVVAAVKLAVSLAMLFTFPIQMMPVIEMAERFLRDRRGDARSTSKVDDRDRFLLGGEGDGADKALLDNVADGGSRVASSYGGASGPGIDADIEGAAGGDDNNIDGGDALFSWRVRISLVLVCVVAALLFGQVFSQVLGLVGSLGLSLVSFVLPPLCYTKLNGGFGRLARADQIGVAVVLAVGAVGVVASTVVEVEQLVAYFAGRNDQCRTSAS